MKLDSWPFLPISILFSIFNLDVDFRFWSLSSILILDHNPYSLSWSLSLISIIEPHFHILETLLFIFLYKRHIFTILISISIFLWLSVSLSLSLSYLHICFLSAISHPLWRVAWERGESECWGRKAQVVTLSLSFSLSLVCNSSFFRRQLSPNKGKGNARKDENCRHYQTICTSNQ
jgi:hypothetical protein